MQRVVRLLCARPAPCHEVEIDTSRPRIAIDATLVGEYGALRHDACLVAFRHGAAAGAVLVVEHSIWDPQLPGPFVIDLFVTPAARGHGVATTLVMAAIEACRATGDATLSLRVGTGTSAAAHAIYATLGFVDPGQ